MDFSGLQNGEPFPHNRHAALIEVLEWFRRWSAPNAAVNQLARIPALLQGHLSDSRERFAVLIERGGVADHKDFRVSWHGEVRLHAYSSCSISIHVEPLTCGRGRNPRGPDNCFADDTFTRDDDAVRIDLINTLSEANFNAQLLKSRFCGFGEILGKTRQNSRRHVDKHDSGGRRIDPAEFRLKNAPHEDGESSGHFDARRAGAD